MRHRHRLIAATGLTTAALALAGCSTTPTPTTPEEPNTGPGTTSALTELLPERILDAGALVLGNSPPYPPFSVIADDGSNTGLDIQLGEALGEALGIPIQWQFEQWAQLQPSLASERIDAIISGSSDRPGDHDIAWFVDYLNNGPTFIMQTTRAEELGIQEQTDLCGLNISREFNATQYDEYLDDFNQTACVDAGLPAMIMVDASESAQNFVNMETGRADAAVEPAVNAGYRAEVLDPGVYTVIGDPFYATMNGIQLRIEDDELRDALVAALAQLLEEGTYAEIAAEWGLESLVPDQVYVNLEPVA